MNKYKVLSIFFGLLGVVSLWFGVYNLRLSQIDKSVSAMEMNIDIANDVKAAEVSSVNIIIDDEVFSIQSAGSLGLKAGDTVDVEVTYTNDEVIRTKAYVAFNSDLSDYVVRYDDSVEGSGYGRIVLPSNKGVE